MKKFISILIILIVSLPFVVSHFLKLPQEEKNKDTEVVQNKEEDLKDSLNTPDYKPKNDDFTVIDEAPPIPPDPFENVRMNGGMAQEDIDRLEKFANEPSPFDKEPEPIPVLDYKPSKNDELLYETISYRDDIEGVSLPRGVGEYKPIKLNFEPNGENLKNIESFKILSLDGEELVFDKFDTSHKFSENSNIYRFEDTKSRGHNRISIVYTDGLDINDNPSIGIFVDHINGGSFKGTVNIRTKKGYIFNYKPDPPGTVYGNDVAIPPTRSKN